MYKLKMMELKTIYTSNIPIDCHILKGRLETDGLTCFIFDENYVWIDPFKAVAIGGVKLKVPSDQKEIAEKIISLVHIDKLIDENGEYEMADVFENEISRRNEILEIKTRIRNDPYLLDKPSNFNTIWLSQYEIDQVIDSERHFLEFSNREINFSWEQFLSELFDFNGRIFKYIRKRPVEYYIDKELVDNYNNQTKAKSSIICPNCSSDNNSYGYAIDYKWDILYLILSLLIHAPFPLIRKKYHCFNCGFDFNNKKSGYS
jgi:hypothetical protein